MEYEDVESPETMEYKNVVINTCFGGFGISDEGKSVLEKRGVILDRWDDEEKLRTNKDLINLIKEGKINMNGDCASLSVVRIPKEYYDSGFWRLNEYDGAESIELDREGYKVFAKFNALKAKLLSILDGEGSDAEKVTRARKLVQK